VLEPTASKAVSSGAGVKLVSQCGPNAQNAVMLGNYRWAQANRDLLRRTLVAWLKEVADVQNGGWRSDANIAILEQYTGASGADLLASGLPHWPPDGAINTPDVLKQEQFFRERGYITYSSPLAEDKLEDLSFLQAARQSLGR
jgi:ABC-type nitrate/sulfonate/bicarbonate transport system substrate-binding protein